MPHGPLSSVVAQQLSSLRTDQPTVRPHVQRDEAEPKTSKPANQPTNQEKRQVVRRTLLIHSLVR